MLHASDKHVAALNDAVHRKDWFVDERLWSFLAAALIAEAPQRFIPLFCAEPLGLPKGGRVVCEAEPISTRSPREGNTCLDIAFGHVAVRPGSSPGAAAQDTAAGITYLSREERSWVCFVEAKYLSDAGVRVTHDPLRNQLTRVIENLLCFQERGEFPTRLCSALLTPRAFRDAPRTRLYGYKMADYRHPALILEDISACTLERRTSAGYEYPELSERIRALATPRWVTFEEILGEAGLGDALDVLRRPGELGHVREKMITALVGHREQRMDVLATRAAGIATGQA